MRLATLFAVAVVHAVAGDGADASENQFIVPQPSGVAKDYSQNLVLSLGSLQVIQWNTTVTDYYIALFQQTAQDGGIQHSTIYDSSSGDETGNVSFEWEVQADGTSLSLSNIYFLWLNPGAPEGFTSHYFNISTESVTTVSVPAPGSSPPTSTLTEAPPSTAATSAGSTSTSTAATFTSSAAMTMPSSVTVSTPRTTAASSSRSTQSSATALPPLPPPRASTTTSTHTTASTRIGAEVGLGVGFGVLAVLLTSTGAWLGVRMVQQRQASRGATDGSPSKVGVPRADEKSIYDVAGKGHPSQVYEASDSVRYEFPPGPLSPAELANDGYNR